MDEGSFRLTAGDPWLYWLEDNAYGLDVAIEDVTELGYWPFRARMQEIF